MIYLACPYSDPDPDVRERRFQVVNKAAGALIQKGAHVFSPISHTHPIVLVSNLPQAWSYWREYDQEILACCSEMVILMLDGWRESEGVQAEIAIAGTRKMKIFYWGTNGIQDNPGTNRDLSISPEAKELVYAF